MKKKLFILILLTSSFIVNAQNVGIGTSMPQATLDVKGNQRFGGINHYTTYDSVSGKIEWKNSNLYVPVSQYLMQHSAAADGLYYNNSGGINGQLEYRNALGNPVFYTNFLNGNGYFKSRLGISTVNPLAGLHVADSSVLFSAAGDIPGIQAIVPMQGAGRRMLWYADKAAFRAGYVNGAQWDKNNIGTYSMAAGFGTTASQGYSTALGFFSNASGVASTALGNQTTAKAFGSLSIGSLNDNTDNPDPLNPGSTDRIFQIGNGFGFFPGNAMTVLRNGNVGIGSTLPLSRLHVADSSVLFSATGNVLVSPGLPPVQGAGRRMMWHSGKAAFRVGYVDNAYWDDYNIGYYSFAAGVNTSAQGSNSTALGSETIASGLIATALGERTTASGRSSTALGANTIANGDFSTAIGYGTTAKAFGSLSMGTYNDLTDNPDPFFPDLSDRIFQIGNSTFPSFGNNAITVLRNGNTGIGVNNPTATLEVVRGTGGGGTAVFKGTTHISHFNYNTDEDTYIRAGKNNRYVILNDIPGGKVGIGTTAPSEMLEVNGTIKCVALIQTSDSRLKKGIVPLQNSLQKITQITGYHYYWMNENAGNRLQTGVLAQEVQKLFPELVTENKDGTLAVNYSGLIPVMIESIKKQQKQIDELKKIVEKLLKQ